MQKSLYNVADPRDCLCDNTATAQNALCKAGYKVSAPASGFSADVRAEQFSCNAKYSTGKCARPVSGQLKALCSTGQATDKRSRDVDVLPKTVTCAVALRQIAEPLPQRAFCQVACNLFQPAQLRIQIQHKLGKAAQSALGVFDAGVQVGDLFINVRYNAVGVSGGALYGLFLTFHDALIAVCNYLCGRYNSIFQLAGLSVKHFLGFGRGLGSPADVANSFVYFRLRRRQGLRTGMDGFFCNLVCKGTCHLFRGHNAVRQGLHPLKLRFNAVHHFRPAVRDGLDSFGCGALQLLGRAIINVVSIVSRFHCAADRAYNVFCALQQLLGGVGNGFRQLFGVLSGFCGSPFAGLCGSFFAARAAATAGTVVSRSNII